MQISLTGAFTSIAGVLTLNLGISILIVAVLFSLAAIGYNQLKKQY